MRWRALFPAVAFVIVLLGSPLFAVSATSILSGTHLRRFLRLRLQSADHRRSFYSAEEARACSARGDCSDAAEILDDENVIEPHWTKAFVQSLPTERDPAARSLNPLWSSNLPCNYGELPGMWLPHFAKTIKDFEDRDGTIVTVDRTNLRISNVTHGSGWQVFEPTCQLHNYVHDILMGHPRQSPDPQRPINIVMIGDSVDRIPIGLFDGMLMNIYNRSDRNRMQELQPYSLSFQGTWHLEAPRMGLNLYYGFLTGQYVNNDIAAGARAVGETYNVWKRERPAMVPDVVLINSAYWDLHEAQTNTETVPDAHDILLLPEFINAYMRATSTTLQAVRRAWPDAYIIWRSTPITRVTLETGEPGADHKDWAFKMHIAQINAAARHVCKEHNIPFVDVERMCAGLTPAQADFDIHHPRDFLVTEYLNIVLNLAYQYLRAKEIPGAQE